MNLKDYIKDKIVYILMYIVLLITILFLLYMFRVPTTLIISVTIVMVVFIIGIILYDYFIKMRFYNNFIDNLNQLDKKYLIAAIINKPSFIEGQILYDSLYEIDKSMYEEIESYLYRLNLKNGYSVCFYLCDLHKVYYLDYLKMFLLLIYVLYNVLNLSLHINIHSEFMFFPFYTSIKTAVSCFCCCIFGSFEYNKLGNYITAICYSVFS